MNFNDHYKVRLANSNSANSIEEARRSVVFDVTPELSESRNVNYKMYDPVHAPGQIVVYQSTSSRRFQLTQVRLVSRSPREASNNLAKLWVLRGWTMPTFGQQPQNIRTDAAREARLNSDGPLSNDFLREIIDDISSASNSANYLGSPPPVLLLSAYSRLGVSGNVGTGSIGHLKKIPVVIESLNINYPSEVDYIPTEGVSPTPMPTIMTVDISLIEAHSPNELERFNLQQFKRGELPGF